MCKASRRVTNYEMSIKIGLRDFFVDVERSTTSLERSNRFVLQHNIEIPEH